jgi:KipI family sensor histidine kinase inhibitor
MSAEPYAVPRFLPAGESALTVEFGNAIDPAIHDLVLGLDAALASAEIDGITETVPTYRSLMIHFDPRRLTTEDLIAQLQRLDGRSQIARDSAKRWLIPVCYEEPVAEDLAEVAAALGLTPARIVDLHRCAQYRVYMYGFSPGFTFLGGLPSELAISRRLSPRPPAPEGALLIAGGQALISSFAMPTGWYMLGRTPVKVFDKHRTPACLIGIGDEIHFEAVDLATFKRLEAEVAAGVSIARVEA